MKNLLKLALMVILPGGFIAALVVRIANFFRKGQEE